MELADYILNRRICFHDYNNIPDLSESDIPSPNLIPCNNYALEEALVGGSNDDEQYVQETVAPRQETAEDECRTCENDREDRISRLKILNQTFLSSISEKENVPLETYKELYTEVNHEIVAHHDEEINLGITTTLCHFLSMLQNAADLEMVFEDICLICLNLERIYRQCSPKSIEESYREIGNALLQNLINAWDICTNGTCRRDKYIAPIIKIFSHFVNVKTAREYMAANNELLDVLVRAVDIAYMYTTLTAVHAYCIDPLWIISILTLADSASIVCHSGVLKVLTKASQGHAEMKKEVAASILNLTSKQPNHSMLLSYNGILETIRCLLLSTELSAKRRAAGALRNLASNKSIRARLISFKRGRIVDDLVKVGNSDFKSKASRHAAEALRKLAEGISSSELIESSEIMQAIAKMACSQNRFVRHFVTKLVVNQAKKAECSEASCKFIFRCLTQIHDKTSDDNASNLLQISEAFLFQSCMLANREPMVRYDGLLQAISKLAISEHGEIRHNALSTLQKLANNPANQNVICNNKAVLGTAKQMLRKEGNGYDETKKLVFDLIALLALEEENRSLLADCKELVNAMLHYTRSTADSDGKSDGINAIMLLAQRAKI